MNQLTMPRSGSDDDDKNNEDGDGDVGATAVDAGRGEDGGVGGGVNVVGGGNSNKNDKKKRKIADDYEAININDSNDIADGEKQATMNDDGDDDDKEGPTKKQKRHPQEVGTKNGNGQNDHGRKSETVEDVDAPDTDPTTTDNKKENSKKDDLGTVDESEDVAMSDANELNAINGGIDGVVGKDGKHDPIEHNDGKGQVKDDRQISKETAPESTAAAVAAAGSNSDQESSTGNSYESIKYAIVQNDGRPESLIKLVALKSLFSKQLPKMPRAYIARLVFDRRHISLAILNKDPATKDTDEEVIGAICYRPFHDMKFAEIAFCAVNSSHQVKGYGTKLMNLVKQEGARSGIEYFITYADNYAIGYFKKQGFSKTISMPKGRYEHLIKDYDGGTMMECYVHPSIDFTRVKEMIEAQRQYVLSRIRLKANSTTVYDALPKDWKPNLEGLSRGNELAARAMAIPGMVEAGWTIHDLQLATGQGKDADRARSALRSEMLTIVRKVDEQQFAWPFREPVDTSEVKDYLDVIKEPIDLSTIDKRIRKGDYYKSKKMLYTDLTLMVNNCKLYNEEASAYVQCAVKLENYLKQLFQDV